MRRHFSSRYPCDSENLLVNGNLKLRGQSLEYWFVLHPAYSTPLEEYLFAGDLP